MAMNFPDAPSVDDEFTVGDQTWKWTGTVWQTVTITSYTPSAHAPTHELGGSDELALAQSQITDLTTDLALKLDEVNGAVTTADTSSTVVRNITLSTSAPTGGADGDVWLVYTA